MASCGTCGQDLPAGAAFCDSCQLPRADISGPVPAAQWLAAREQSEPAEGAPERAPRKEPRDKGRKGSRSRSERPARDPRRDGGESRLEGAPAPVPAAKRPKAETVLAAPRRTSAADAPGAPQAAPASQSNQSSRRPGTVSTVASSTAVAPVGLPEAAPASQRKESLSSTEPSRPADAPEPVRRPGSGTSGDRERTRVRRLGRRDGRPDDEARRERRERRRGPEVIEDDFAEAGTPLRTQQRFAPPATAEEGAPAATRTYAEHRRDTAEREAQWEADDGREAEYQRARAGRSSTEVVTSWPHKEITLGGRRVPAEIPWSALMQLTAAITLAVSVAKVPGLLPTLAGDLRGDAPYAFSAAYGSLIAIGFLAFTLIGLLIACVGLMRVIESVRGIVVACALVLLALIPTVGNLTTSVLYAAAALSCAGTFAVIASPWVNRFFSDARHAQAPRGLLDDDEEGSRVERRAAHRTPATVRVVTQMLIIVNAYMTFMTALLFLGLRFVGNYGASYVVAIVFAVLGMVAAWVGYSRLVRRPDTVGRALVTAGAALWALSMLLITTGTNLIFVAVALVGVTLPLWAAEDAREWFGEKPIDYSI